MNAPEPPEPPEPLDKLVQWARRIAIGISRARHMFHRADLAESAALEALSRALNGFDPGRGKFRTYAVKGIVGAVLDEIGPEAQRLAFEVAFDAADADAVEADDAGPSDAPADELAAEVMAALAAAYMGEEQRLNGEAGLLTQEAIKALHQHVDALPDQDRRLVVLRYWEERTWQEVGAALGISDRTAREHDLRIRIHLKDALLEETKRTVRDCA
jgi:RNA polymerase sigma factor for flagellar operon FliA